MSTDIELIQARRKQIGALAESMIDMIKNGEIEERECPVTHRFAKGCYLREILMPKGTVIVGKIHATEHFNIILTGSVSVATVDGVEHFEAPHTFISLAGIQKIVICHSDCIWQTVHVTEETDLNEIEKAVIVDDYDKLEIDGLVNKLSGGEL